MIVFNKFVHPRSFRVHSITFPLVISVSLSLPSSYSLRRILLLTGKRGIEAEVQSFSCSGSLSRILYSASEPSRKTDKLYDMRDRYNRLKTYPIQSTSFAVQNSIIELLMLFAHLNAVLRWLNEKVLLSWEASGERNYASHFCPSLPPGGGWERSRMDAESQESEGWRE